MTNERDRERDAADAVDELTCLDDLGPDRATEAMRKLGADACENCGALGELTGYRLPHHVATRFALPRPWRLARNGWVSARICDACALDGGLKRAAVPSKDGSSP